jgi:hypothetical protein
MVFRWTFHYLNFLFLSRQPFLCFFLHFMTPPKPNHKLYSWLINFDSISHNIRIWFTKFPIIKFSCFLLLVNFLPHLIHTSLTYNMLKLFVPPLNLFLIELGLRGLRVPLFLSMQWFVSFTNCSHHNAYHKVYQVQIQNFFSSHSTLTWPTTHVPWSLVFLW